MIEVKVVCGCGTKYKFDVEPVHGQMPSPVKCPACGADGTAAANEFIRSVIGSPTPAPVGSAAAPPVPPSVGKASLRIAGGVAPTEVAAVADAGAIASVSPAGGSQPLLQRSLFFIRERVAVLKLVDTFDILDPVTGGALGVAKEEPPGWAKWLRLLVNKHQLPTAVNIYEAEGHPPVLSIRRGFTFLRSKVRVTAGGQEVGYFKSKLFSLGGGFNVFDNQDQQVAEVKGDWKGWNFRFLSKAGREIGTVTKKWAGLGRELFSSADNYVIAITDVQSAGSPAASALLLAAGLAIDIVFKEGKG